MNISLFHGVRDAHPVRTVTLDAVLEAIRTGAYRAPIQQLRQIRSTRGHAAYNAVKQRLDAVTFGGIFAPTRSKTTLVQHSGLVHGDLDHLADPQDAKQCLCAEPTLVYAFLSPGGDGLKVGVNVEPVADDGRYKHAWQTVADHFQTCYGLMWDPSGKDICRLCFVSWDSNCYVNPTAQVFSILPASAAEIPRRYTLSSPWRVAPGGRRDWYARQALDTAVKMIEASTPGNRHFWRRKAAYLLGGCVAGGILTADEALNALAAAVERNTAHLAPSLKTIEACLAAGMQQPITIEYLAQAHRQWRATHWSTQAKVWTGQLRTVAAEEIPPWHA